VRSFSSFRRSDIRRRLCRRVRGGLFFVLTWACAAVCAASGQTKEKLVIGGDFNYPPYEYLDRHGRPAGYNVELTRAIAETMGLHIEIRLGSWGEIRDALESGKIDAVHGMFYSKERDQAVDFSPPHTIVNHAVFVRKDAEPILSLDALRGKAIIVMRGDIMHDYVVEKGLCERPILAETQADALRMLASGRHDCALAARLPGLYRIRELKLADIVTTGPLIRPSQYCYAVKHGNSELLAAFVEGLAILKRNGRYKGIYEKWLGVLERPGLRADVIVNVGLCILGTLCVLLIGALVWFRTLKRRVAQKTEELAIRLGYEKGLAACSQSLLLERPGAATLALRKLLQCTGVSRIYIFENFSDDKDGLCMRQIHEVCAPGVSAEIDNPMLRHLPYEQRFVRWRERLCLGDPVFGLVESFPEQERGILETQGILSILVLPIFVQDEWYGFIGFDDTATLRKWTDEDIRLLQTAGEMIGAYFERKDISERLRESEERLRLVLDATSDGVWDWDAHTGKVTFSPGYWTMLGWAPDEFPQSYETWSNLLHPEDKARAEAVVKRHLESGGRGFEIEFRMKKKGGGWKWILSRGKTVACTPTGAPLRVVGTHVDIEKRKEAEAALEAALERANDMALESELARLESDQILNTSADGMCVIDSAFNIVRVNDAFCDMAQRQRKESVGDKCYRVFPAEDCHTDQCPMVHVMKSEARIECEQKKTRCDGSTMHCIVNATPWKDISGNLLGIVQDLKDINERKQAERALRESEVRIRTILDNMQTGIVIVDMKDHVILDANPAAVNLIGAPRSDIVGRVCHRFICPAEKSQCPISDLGQTVDNSERILLQADGRRLSILKTVVVTVLGGRDVLLESFFDITERKEMERQQLEKEKLEAVIEMAGAVCHELNQPMQAVASYAELLKPEPEEDPACYEAVSRIHEQTLRMGRITGKLMRITKYETKDYVFPGKRIIDIDKASLAGDLLE
jgi:PAS domain S-box-containing protein